MLQFIKKTLFLLPVLVLLVSVNYVIDPGNLFRGDNYERGISQLLLKGFNVANVSNYDERLVQKFYIEGLWAKKDIVVVGSSRSMQIKSTLFPNKSFFNNSVSGASLEDILAIYHQYRKRNLLPDNIIISLDPWLLNVNNEQIRWKSIGDDYFEMSREMTDKKSKSNHYSFISFQIPEKYLELVSLSYFQKSFEMLTNSKYKTNNKITYKENLKEYYTTNNLFEDVLVRASDGTPNYDTEFRNANVDEVNKRAIGYINENPIYSLGNYYVIDDNLKNKFEMFIDTVKNDNVEITFFLSPYHPKVFDFLLKSEKYKIIIDVQNYFEYIALKKNIRIIGSYNPKDLSLNESDFFDGMHPREKAINKIFEVYNRDQNNIYSE